MTWTSVPVTPDLWPAFEELFGKQGACYGCWCTYFRQPPAARRDNDHMRNKDLIRARIEAGPPPGLLAFEDGKAVGWMQIGPRADVPEWNNKGSGSAPVDPGDAIRSGGMGDFLLLHPHQSARQGAHAPACRRRTDLREGERRALRRGLPDGPVDAIRARSACSSARPGCSRRPGSRASSSARLAVH